MLEGHARDRNLYFPWGFKDGELTAALAKYEPALGIKMSAVLARARDTYRHERHHVEALKRISNSGKHWELLGASGAMHAVALYTQNEKRIFALPNAAFKEADEYEFHRDANRLPRVPLEILIGVSIEGLPADLPNSPDSILNCSFRFVAGMIEAVEQAGDAD